MSERYVELVGAEQVGRAASQMTSAAERMMSAASAMDDTVSEEAKREIATRYRVKR